MQRVDLTALNAALGAHGSVLTLTTEERRRTAAALDLTDPTTRARFLTAARATRGPTPRPRPRPPVPSPVPPLSPGVAFERKVGAELAAGAPDYRAALTAAARKYPELHAAYLADANRSAR